MQGREVVRKGWMCKGDVQKWGQENVDVEGQ